MSQDSSCNVLCTPKKALLLKSNVLLRNDKNGLHKSKERHMCYSLLQLDMSDPANQAFDLVKNVHMILSLCPTPFGTDI